MIYYHFPRWPGNSILIVIIVVGSVGKQSQPSLALALYWTGVWQKYLKKNLALSLYSHRQSINCKTCLKASVAAWQMCQIRTATLLTGDIPMIPWDRWAGGQFRLRSVCWWSDSDYSVIQGVRCHMPCNVLYIMKCVRCHAMCQMSWDVSDVMQCVRCLAMCQMSCNVPYVMQCFRYYAMCQMSCNVSDVMQCFRCIAMYQMSCSMAYVMQCVRCHLGCATGYILCQVSYLEFVIFKPRIQKS